MVIYAPVLGYYCIEQVNNVVRAQRVNAESVREEFLKFFTRKVKIGFGKRRFNVKVNASPDVNV